MNKTTPITPPDNQDTPPRLALRPREAAVALGISERKLWSLTNQGLIPHFKMGRSVRYPTRELADWMAEQAVAGKRGGR